MLTAVFSTRRVLIRRCSVTLTQAVLACPPAVTSISSGATQVYFTHLNTRQPHSITPELNSVFDTAAAHAQLPSQVSCKHASLTIACSQRRHLSGTASSCGGHTFSAGTNINANTTTGNNSGNSGSGNTNSNTSSPQKLPEGVLVVPFPKLSHTMTTGQLVKWHKAPGDKVNMVRGAETEALAVQRICQLPAESLTTPPPDICTLQTHMISRFLHEHKAHPC